MRIINNASGLAANNTDLITDPTTPNPAFWVRNPDPQSVLAAMPNTVYFWADVWDTAQISIYISPQYIPTYSANLPPFPVCLQDAYSNPPGGTPSITPVWFPLYGAGGPVQVSGSNQYTSFTVRWAMLKAVVTNASALTTNLNCTLSGLPG